MLKAAVQEVLLMFFNLMQYYIELYSLKSWQTETPWGIFSYFLWEDYFWTNEILFFFQLYNFSK